MATSRRCRAGDRIDEELSILALDRERAQRQVRLGEAGTGREVVTPAVARAGDDRSQTGLPLPGGEVGALMAAGELDRRDRAVARLADSNRPAHEVAHMQLARGNSAAVPIRIQVT